MTQNDALDILKLGHSVYLTGSAGSGKTFVLNTYLNYLKEEGIVAGITASTGVAATQINGLTINSWSGIGIKRELSE
jgi:ATP-dependent DNA helicase PIF1